jgi:hypothetical protein
MKKSEGGEGVRQTPLDSSHSPESVAGLGSSHAAAASYVSLSLYESVVNMRRMRGTVDSRSWLL